MITPSLHPSADLTPDAGEELRDLFGICNGASQGPTLEGSLPTKSINGFGASRVGTYSVLALHLFWQACLLQAHDGSLFYTSANRNWQPVAVSPLRAAYIIRCFDFDTNKRELGSVETAPSIEEIISTVKRTIERHDRLLGRIQI